MKDDKNELESQNYFKNYQKKVRLTMMNLKKRRTKLFQNGKCILKFDIKIKGKIIK